MSRKARHATSDVVTMFARQGIAISTIARAMALPAERVLSMCRRAQESDELQIVPPHAPEDTKGALLAELTNLRAQLDDAQEMIRSFEENRTLQLESLAGIAGFTRSEAKIASAILRYGRATKAALYHALYGASETGKDPKIVDVFICKIRKKLAPHEIEIETIWGLGYSITTENAVRLRALSEGAELGPAAAAPRLVHVDLAPEIHELLTRTVSFYPGLGVGCLGKHFRDVEDAVEIAAAAGEQL